MEFPLFGDVGLWRLRSLEISVLGISVFGDFGLDNFGDFGLDISVLCPESRMVLTRQGKK